jgi:glyoxylase-like metal-dependent hydrolase (beta-lactamase superfamily II)
MISIEAFYDPATNTLSYVVHDPKTHDAVILDSVLDYDPAAARISTASVEKLITFVKDKRLNVRMLLETHAHADHLSASQVLKEHFPHAPLAIGERIREVQATFKDVFDLPALKSDGSQFDRLLKDGEVVEAGSLSFKVLATPGHTPACCCYLFEDALFTGDLMFMPDGGTGRCDFPGGDAEALYRSVTEKVYQLPDTTRIFTCHDYQPGGRPLKYESTVGEEKAKNIQLAAATTKDAFVKFRTERDKTLSAPKLIYPSVQINIDAGKLPERAKNGRRYLKIPLQT